MARVSFGPRAGSMSDYNGGNVNVNVFSQPIASGPFDSLDALSEALKSVLNSAADDAALHCSTVELRLSLNAVIVSFCSRSVFRAWRGAVRRKAWVMC